MATAERRFLGVPVPPALEGLVFVSLGILKLAAAPRNVLKRQ
jgi:hypothetical protein